MDSPGEGCFTESSTAFKSLKRGGSLSTMAAAAAVAILLGENEMVRGRLFETGLGVAALLDLARLSIVWVVVLNIRRDEGNLFLI